jgi:hypothetical protein
MCQLAIEATRVSRTTLPPKCQAKSPCHEPAVALSQFTKSLPVMANWTCVAQMAHFVAHTPVRAPAFGVHPALRNDLAIKMCELLDQPDVLEESRTDGRLFKMFALSGTGAPVALVERLGFDIRNSYFHKLDSEWRVDFIVLTTTISRQL